MARIWAKFLILLSLLALMPRCAGDPAAAAPASDAVVGVEVTSDLATEADVAPDAQAIEIAADVADEPPDIAEISEVSAPEVQPDAAEPVDTGPQCPADCAQKKAAPCQFYTCEAGVCALKQAADATPCDDGNGCTIGDACAKGACVPGKAVICAADNNPCTGDACDPTTGKCLYLPIGVTTACDDGNTCTVNDTCCLVGQKGCVAGVCKPGPDKCVCSGTDPAECEAKLGDGNYCNGWLYCDTTLPQHACLPVPNSTIKCDTSDDSACGKAICVPATGKCVQKAINENGPCPSNDACAQNSCAKGQCKLDTKLCECATNADCASKNNNLCSGSWFCDKSKPGAWKCAVSSASAITCSTAKDDACGKNVCNPLTGKCKLTPIELLDCNGIGGACKPLPADAKPNDALVACSDGNICTNGDLCGGGVCKPGGNNTCNCVKDADCLAEEDGDFCNGTLYCDVKAGKCKVNPATVVGCGSDKNGFCNSILCQNVKNAQGLAIGATCTDVAQNEGKACNDGDLCTTGDACGAGKCVSGTNTCACSQDIDCAKFDDGNACNGTLYCDKSGKTPTCTLNPATIVVCPQGLDSACSKNLCDPISGSCKATAVQENLPCDADGNGCTSGDHCEVGVCKAGINVCQCQADKDCAKFEDGDACNGNLYCNLKTNQCALNPATVVVCQTVDDNFCRHNVCEAATGVCKLVARNENLACDADGNPCTQADLCAVGVCVPGANTCNCQSNADCAVQDDDNLCNGQLYCKLESHTCAVNLATVVQCPLSNAQCLKNVCDGVSGKCGSKPLADGLACEDGKSCTYGDICSGGACTGGSDLCGCNTYLDCLDDGNLCNGLAFCDKSQSPPACGSTPAIVCTPGGAGCANTACNVKSGQCEDNPKDTGCDDNNACTLDSCTAKGVCVNSPLADGNPCGSGVCVGAKCKNAPDGMTFVPYGTVWIGCNGLIDAQCAVDESPAHYIELSPVFADRYEVTAGQFANCVNAGACEKPAKIDAACNVGTPTREQNPANCVTFLQAAAYCKFADKRLPSEAEWESLARGRCFSPNCKEIIPRFPWGNQPTANCNYAWMAGSFAAGCNLGTTLAVGARPLDKSPYGLYDMAGNVREWTMDSYEPDFYKKIEATKANPLNLSVSNRVVRGGGILSQSKDMRTSRRDFMAPTQAASDVGFRCVREPNP